MKILKILASVLLVITFTLLGAYLGHAQNAASGKVVLDETSIKPGKYTVCNNSSYSPNFHLKLGDKVKIGPKGLVRDVQFGRQLVPMIDHDGKQLAAVVNFVHTVNGVTANVPHLVRIVRDPGYAGADCLGTNILAVNFCPQSTDGQWTCPVLDCTKSDTCHGGDVHINWW